LLNFAEVEQRLHVGVRRTGGERECLAQVYGGVGVFADAEKQDTEVGDGVMVRGRQ